MFQNEVVIFGDGLLGGTIRDLTGWDIISRKMDGVDINKRNTYGKHFLYYKQILNCVACTDTYSNNRQEHWSTNYLGVMKLVHFANRYNQKLVQISSDYIYANSVPFASEEDVPSNAANWYSYTKLLGDAYVQAMCKDYLLVRTSFKPAPFPYPKAITTQEGNFDYVDKVSKLIIKLIEKNASGVYNVGNPQMRSIYDLALETNPNVKPLSEKIHESMPTDITMNLDKMTSFLEEQNAECS